MPFAFSVTIWFSKFDPFLQVVFDAEKQHFTALQISQLMLLGKSVWIQEHLKMQSGEESSSSRCFNPVGRLQQSGLTDKQHFTALQISQLRSA